MKLKLAFSPCPNDTFIFDALIHSKIDTRGYQFEVLYEDVENLNKGVFAEQYDISKLSYHAYAYARDNYQLLNSGSALGFGVGPLIICKDPNLVQKIKNNSIDLKTLKVAIPGVYTTANFLLGIAYPAITNKVTMLFSSIEEAVIQGEVDLGLIIHENRFTYPDKGLFKVEDLGEYWERTTQHPIPLGGIAVKRSLPEAVKKDINDLIQESIEYAFKNPGSSKSFIKSLSQEMDDEVIKQHIDLYVNKFSIDLGPNGKEAITFLMNKAIELELIPQIDEDIFLNSVH